MAASAAKRPRSRRKQRAAELAAADKMRPATIAAATTASLSAQKVTSERAAAAKGWALAVKSAVLGLLRESRARKLHLFLSCPNASALFLGHELTFALLLVFFAAAYFSPQKTNVAICAT